MPTKLNDYMLPYGGGMINADGGNYKTTTRAFAAAPPVQPPARGPIFNQGPVSTPPSGGGTPPPSTGAPTVPPQFINPKTGGFYSPNEFADQLAKNLPIGAGDIPKFAGDMITKPNQSIEELNQSAYSLNNTRNDMAVGETDPYKVASGSGLQYSPQQLKAIENAYAGIYDPALTEVFSKLEKAQAERDASLKKGAGGTGGGAGGQLSNLAQAVKDGFIDIKSLTPTAQGQVAAELSASGAMSPGQKESSGTIDLVNNLLGSDYQAITGAAQNPLNLFGVANAEQQNWYKTLKGRLALGARELIKGTGAISDYESKTLNEAASALGRNLSNKDFAEELKKIRGVLLINNGGEATVIVRSPSGEVLGQGNLTREEIYEAVTDGNVIEYQ